MSLSSIVGFGLLFGILGMLWIANSVADEMLEG